MGSSWFQALLLVSAILILSLSLSHGSGREIMVENVGYEDNNAAVLLEERAAREMMQLDYIEAGPNFNPRSGNLFSPPPPPQSPPPLPPPPPHHPRF